MLTLLLKNRFLCWKNSLLLGHSPKRRRRILGIFGLLFIPIFMFFNFLFLYRTILAEIVDGEKWLYVFFSASMLGLFFMMVFSALALVIHSLFLSKDLNLLLSSPLDIKTIFQYKLIEASIANSTLFFVIGLPLIVALGLSLHLSIAYYFYASFCSIFFLCIPVGLAASLTIILTSIMPAKKAKNLATIVFSLLSLLIWMALQYLRPERIHAQIGVYSTDYVQMIQSKAATYTSYLPSQWLSDALFAFIRADSTALLKNTLLLISVCFALYFLAAPLLQRTMRRDLFSGRLGQISIKSTVAAKYSAAAPKRTSRAPIWFSIWLKDIKILFRDSRYSMQIFLYAAIMIIIPLISSHPNDENLTVWQPYLPYLYLLLFSALMASSWAAKLIPAEERAFSYLLCSPQRRRTFIIAKTIVAFSLTLTVCLLALMVIQLIRPASMTVVVHVIIALSALILASSGSGIALGAYFANYQWDHPKRMLTPTGNLAFIILTLLMLGSYILITITISSLFSIPIGLSFLLLLTIMTAWFGTVLAEKRLDRQEWLY